MSLIPEEYYTPRLSFNFAPMVDFLFIVTAIFAILYITRKAVYDSRVNLTYYESPIQKLESNPYPNAINLSISASGEYTWLNEKDTQIMTSISMVRQEILKQVAMGHLSPKPSENHILLHIDQQAHWNSIANLLLAMHEEGFAVYPIYQKKEKKPFILQN